jgi:gamma-glutamyl-gamma-aminobutyrate hydrolase PuuD
MTKVYIVGGDYSIERMFIARGWELTKFPDEANLIQFTGGSDVDPSLYGEEKHARTWSDPRRDAYESHIFRQYENVTPMTGICRGGQFLNVMSGGRMWQDVNNHAIGGTHLAFDIVNKADYHVTSTHHQMMRPSRPCEIIGTAVESSFRESATERNEEKMFPDIEVVYYPHTNVLCFQPHPEYLETDHECQNWYFNLLKEKFGVEA